LSPLLANILLDDLDKELEGRGHRFVRYADDLLILVKSQRSGERVKDSVTRFLTRKLKRVVNEQKSRVVKTNDATFLEFTFRETKLRWSDRAFGDFKHHLRKLTGRSWGVWPTGSISWPNRSAAGWAAWHLGRLSPDPRTRPVASTPGAHVLLETVALRAYQGEASAGAGDG
jgi:RNA-directed DNA polymerase